MTAKKRLPGNKRICCELSRDKAITCALGGAFKQVFLVRADAGGDYGRSRRGFTVLRPVAQGVKDSANHSVSAGNAKTKG